nr:MAG TPA: protein of unknown function DUF440 [Caudoviricetes sp.]
MGEVGEVFYKILLSRKKNKHILWLIVKSSWTLE